jgi:hypothetical protein
MPSANAPGCGQARERTSPAQQRRHAGGLDLSFGADGLDVTDARSAMPLGCSTSGAARIGISLPWRSPGFRRLDGQDRVRRVR